MAEQTARTIKIPGPDHPITIAKSDRKIRVVVGGETIADSGNALTLKEASYPPVHYIPFADVKAGVLRESGHKTYCPYKGECSYYDIVADGQTAKDAVWYYGHPYEAVAAIEGHVAFYTDRVDQIVLS